MIQWGHIAFAAVAIFLIGGFVWYSLPPNERDIHVLVSPDGCFKVVLTHTGNPPFGLGLGMEGNIYIADPDQSRGRWVAHYCTDGFSEVLSYFEWREDKSAFEYRGYSSRRLFIGPKYTPLD